MRSLRWNGGVLSTEASMTCLVLASCRCDRVPAILFTRPYVSQRRWSEDGEICLTDPPSSDMIPQWPLSMISNAKRSPVRGKESCESFIDCKFSSSIEALCEQDLISIERDEEGSSFQMKMSLREEIWKQTSTHDRLLVWFDLLKLVIHSSPDAYAEIFWQTLFHKSKTVIDSTVLPFLSVLEWGRLVRYQVL